jgi:hypothetical protein
MTLRADQLYVQVWLPSNGAAMRPTKAHFEVIGRGVAISRLATGVVARCVWNPYTEPVRRIPFR